MASIFPFDEIRVSVRHGVDMIDYLVKSIQSMTSLPEEFIRNEITQVVIQAGLDPHTISLEDLRLVLADYLQDVLVDTKDTVDHSGSIDSNC